MTREDKARLLAAALFLGGSAVLAALFIAIGSAIR